MKIEYILDVLGNKYIGININPSIPDKTGLTLNNILEVGLTEIPYFSDRAENLLNRNSNKYHLTIFNAAECNTGKIPDNLIGTKITPDKMTYKGIGSISQDEKTTYFVVVDCPILNDIRYAHGFKNKDLHITIAFTHKDLFGQRKNIPNIWIP